LAGLSLTVASFQVIAKVNIFSGNARDIDVPPTGTVVGNVPGGGAGDITYGYPDTKPYEPGYIPGDPQRDRYLYVYPDDETRRIVKKIGEGLAGLLIIFRLVKGQQGGNLTNGKLLHILELPPNGPRPHFGLFDRI